MGVVMTASGLPKQASFTCNALQPAIRIKNLEIIYHNVTQERQELQAAVAAGGGRCATPVSRTFVYNRSVNPALWCRYTPNLSRRVTHLVVLPDCKPSESEKVALALHNLAKWGTRLVTRQWVVASAEGGAMRPETEYEPAAIGDVVCCILSAAQQVLHCI